LLIRQERIPAGSLKTKPAVGLLIQPPSISMFRIKRFYLAAAFLLRIFAKRLFLREAVFL
jgi:hypothetical protein